MNRTKTVVAALAALVMAAAFTGCGDNNLVIEGTVLHGAKDRTKLPANLKIPNGIEEISERAFKECKAIRTVTFPKTLKEIGNAAFEACKYLESVTIPEGVKEISIGAFSECDSLKSVTIENGVKEICGEAFYYCTSLTSVTIPSSVTVIGNDAFQGCESLKSVTFHGTKAQWEAIEKKHGPFGGGSIGTFAVKCTDGELPSQAW